MRTRRTPTIRLGYGVRMAAGLAGPEALVAELQAWTGVVPPDAAFTGLSVARLHGLWLPPLPDGLPHFVAVGRSAGQKRPERVGLHLTRHPHPPESTSLSGVRVVSVAEAILAAARYLDLLDLVVLVDSALYLEKCTMADLRAAAAQRRRGAPALRTALTHADGRSESAWETLLRMLHVSCGIDVEPQVELFDEFGRFVARADLRVTGTNLIQEYDGAEHRTPKGQAHDLRRDRDLIDMGIVRRGYVARDVLDHPHLVLAAADRALGNDRSTSPSPWLKLVAESCYRPAGRRALLARTAGQQKRAGK